VQRVVIVGASLGGLRSAESLRSSGFTGEIVVIGDEPHMPYNRPPLSKDALKGDLSHEAVAFRVRANASDVQWWLGHPAVSSDLASHTVSLANGDVITFDGLIAATGLRPRRLDLPGPAADAVAGRHTLRTLEDALGLRAQLAPDSRVVILGAGFIGCEVAATVSALGCHATCVAIDPLPMVAALGTELAAEVKRRHEAHGTRFRLGTGVEAFLGTDCITGVRLTSGEELVADVVVEAIGSVCNTEWLEGNDLDLTNGVLTDNGLRMLTTSGAAFERMYAVGDIARFPNPLFDAVPRRIEHWSIPTDTGRRAAPLMAAALSPDPEAFAAAAATPFTPMPAFWSDQFDLRLQAFGIPSIADTARLLEGSLDGELVMGYLRQDVLIGVTAIGMTKQVATYRSTIGHPIASLEESTS